MNCALNIAPSSTIMPSNRYLLSALFICALISCQLIQQIDGLPQRHRDGRQSSAVGKPQQQGQLPGVPALPTGPITGTTVDCVNEKFFTIQRSNPKLKPWLTDVQGTVERLFADRRGCDSDTVGQADCIATWNRAAGVQFLRLGLALYEQKDLDGNPLEILTNFVSEFQKCW